MVKKEEAVLENELVEEAEVAAEGGIDVDAIAQSVMNMIGQVAKATMKEEELPPLPVDGIVVTLKPNLTFNGVIWPPGSIIDLGLAQTDPEHRLEDDGWGNPFLNAVRRGEEWTQELAVWMEKTEESLVEADIRSHQIHSDWAASMNKLKDEDYEALDRAIQSGAALRMSQGGQQVEVKVVEVNEIPERVITVGARLTGGDD